MGELAMASTVVSKRKNSSAGLFRGLGSSSRPIRRVRIDAPTIRATVFSRYLNQRETSLLIELVGKVCPKVMIEFGCNVGITAKRVLENVPTIEKYIGIDVPSDFITTLECQLTEVPGRAGGYVADSDRFYLLTLPSARVTKGHLEPCDAIFIDGDHSYKAVMHESKMANDLVREGGIIVWHDFTNAAVEVSQALNELHASGWPIESIEGSWLAYMRK